MGKKLLVLMLACGCQQASVAPPALPETRSGSLSESLELEALSRPSGTARAEDVLRALDSMGLVVREQRQHLGRPTGASYCVGAHLGEALAASVCEYATEAAAVEGRKLSLKAFGSINHREIFVKRKTTFTVLESPSSAQSAKQKQRAVEAFTRL